jgi:hypothetical protein
VTALLSASRAPPELQLSDEIAFIVNIRGMLYRDPGETCAMYASGVSFSRRYRDKESFWDKARTAHNINREKLNDPDAFFGRRASSKILDPIIFDTIIFAALRARKACSTTSDTDSTPSRASVRETCSSSSP